MSAVKRAGAEPGMWTGGASPGPPGDPLTQMARCANGRSEGPPGRLGRRKTARAGRPSAAVRLRQSTSTSADGVGAPVRWKRAPSAMELLCGGHLLRLGVSGGGDCAGEHALGAVVVDDGP